MTPVEVAQERRYMQSTQITYRKVISCKIRKLIQLIFCDHFSFFIKKVLLLWN